MKKKIYIVSIIILILLMLFFYLRQPKVSAYEGKIYTPDKKFYIQQYSIKNAIPFIQKDHSSGYIKLFRANGEFLEEVYVDSLEANPLKIYNDLIISTNEEGPCWELNEDGTVEDCKKGSP